MNRTIAIGGVAVAIPFPLSFATLEKAWPYFEAIGKATESGAADPVSLAGYCIEFLAPVIGRTADEIKSVLLVSEMGALPETVMGILKDNKVYEDAPAGEAQPAAENASTDALTASSSN